MAKQTEAQIRAQEKYDRNNTKQVLLRFNEHTDQDIITMLESVSNKQGYIKALIRQDLQK